MSINELEEFLDLNTDHYFKKTKSIILKNKDVEVTYAIFMRRPVLFCPSLAIKWLRKVEKIRKTSDPIENIKVLLNKMGIEDKMLKEIDMEIKSIIADAAKFAQDSPEPSASELYTDITIN